MFVVSQIRATWPSHYTLLHLTIPIYYTASRPILNKVTYYVYTKMTNKMQLCKIIYYSMSALHVSSDIFAHHQEHPNCISSFWYYTYMFLPVGIMGELEFQLGVPTLP